MIKNKLCTLLVSAGCLLLTGCSDHSDAGVLLQLLSPGETYEKTQETGAVIHDLQTLYENQGGIKTAYLTVGQGNADDGTNHTWEEINRYDLSWYAAEDEEIFQCESLLQFGNETGPVQGEYGFGEYNANSTVRLSGEKASTRQQKNYRIKLKAQAGSIDGMKTIVLSKAFSDPFRFTEKLCFDLMAQEDSLLSVRTRFVHLYVKDVTETQESKFRDYGLYTMLEPISKKYLKARLLDSTGELYKAVDFDFGRHPDVITEPTSANYSKEEMEQLLEAKGSEDYSKLIHLLDVMEDGKTTIEEIVDTYFEKEYI